MTVDYNNGFSLMVNDIEDILMFICILYAIGQILSSLFYSIVFPY